MKRQIGLDFGTTTTVLMYRDHDENNHGIVMPLKFDGVDYVPTMILEEGSIANKKGKLFHTDEKFGWQAEKATTYHSLLKRNFKMDLISSDPAVRSKARELTEKFFKYLYTQYQVKDLEKKDTTVTDISTWVTYPAKFPGDVQNFLKEAAEKAGFSNVRLLDESKAAMSFSLIYDTGRIRHYVDSLKKSKLNVLLIDMGAGTTDIAVFRYDVADPTEFEHICSWPEKGSHNFGGREIDEILCRFYRDKLGSEDIVQELTTNNDPVLADKLLSRLVKDFKDETISPDLANRKTVNTLPGDLENVAINMDEEPDTALDRSRFEQLLKDYLPQFPTLVSGALNQAGMTAGNVDLVLLTGGHSQWYFVRDQLNQLGVPQHAVFGFSDPHMVVAHGAAWYSEPQKSVKNDDLSDCTSVMLETASGQEPAIIQILPSDADTPVVIKLKARAYLLRFRPDQIVKRTSGSTYRIMLKQGNAERILLFPTKKTADIWFDRLSALVPPKSTSPYTWDIPHLLGQFIFGVVVSADDCAATIVFNKPIPRENRLLFFGNDGRRMWDHYCHVHSDGEVIKVRQPWFSRSRPMAVGNVVLVMNLSYPKEYWQFRCTSDPRSRHFKIVYSRANPTIVLEHKKHFLGSLRLWSVQIDNEAYLVRNDSSRTVTVTPGKHHILSIAMRHIAVGVPLLPDIRYNQDVHLDYGDTLMVSFDDGVKLIEATEMRDTSSPALLELCKYET